MNGIIIVNKPCGKTSHDMVSFIRRLTGIKKVGHTGTLDPKATGVLPICIGNATKACELLTLEDKSYRAKLKLGMTTDTLDSEGEVLTRQEVNVTEDEIREVIKSFIGEIEQIPPMYSAIKVGGKKLYELARRGEIIEREKRKVKISDIRIIEINLQNDTVIIEVDCSKGTYIRTLCDDIGAKLKCGAFMEELERIKSGEFDISMAYTKEQLEDFHKNSKLHEYIIPTDKVFLMYPEVVVDDRQKGFIVNGVRTRHRGLLENQLYRVYDSYGNFLCISKCVEERLTLIKAFWDR